MSTLHRFAATARTAVLCVEEKKKRVEQMFMNWHTNLSRIFPCDAEQTCCGLIIQDKRRKGAMMKGESGEEGFDEIRRAFYHVAGFVLGLKIMPAEILDQRSFCCCVWNQENRMTQD